VKTAIKQSLFTLDGLLLKKIFAFGPELSDYEQLAEQTATLFRELFTDYCELPVIVEDENSGLTRVTQKETTYSKIKPWLQMIKRTYHSLDAYTRMEWMYAPLGSEALSNFFGRELERLIEKIETLWTEKSTDYSESVGWHYRGQMLSQTRVLGYLPEVDADRKAEEYRKVIFRELAPISEEVTNHIRTAVHTELRQNGIPTGCLDKRNTDKVSISIQQRVKQKLMFPITESASVANTRLLGGKMEDARKIISLLRKKQWDLWIRDLSTMERVESFRVPKEPGEGNKEKILFWFSIEILMEHLHRRKLQKRRDGDNFAFGEEAEIHISQLFAGSVVHIAEPAKQRNLIKMSSVLMWATHMAAQMLGAVLGQIPDHYQGLYGSDHAWKLECRLGPRSGESAFIYNPDGSAKTGVHGGFQDWKTATDTVQKRKSIAMLLELMTYSGFPRAYARTVILSVSEPIWITEGIGIRQHYAAGEFKETVRFTIDRWMRESSPMGWYLTKIILHLQHVTRSGMQRLFCAEGGVKIVGGTRFDIPTLLGRASTEKLTEPYSTLLIK
jgi:rhodanese-related sulfurtransferase